MAENAGVQDRCSQQIRLSRQPEGRFGRHVAGTSGNGRAARIVMLLL